MYYCPDTNLALFAVAHITHCIEIHHYITWTFINTCIVPVSSNEGRNLDIVVVGVSTEVMGGNSIEGNASPESVKTCV
jgi:hypothetical protein